MTRVGFELQLGRLLSILPSIQYFYLLGHAATVTQSTPVFL